MEILRYGERALLVDCGARWQTAALYAELRRLRECGALAPMDDLVPAERSILLDGLADPAGFALDLAALIRRVEDRSEDPSPVGASADADAGTVEIDVCYDGPDVLDVARGWGVEPEQVARVHTGFVYQSAFCGFAPGFAYLTGLPERYWLSRRPSPRAAVPAGSVAVAGPYTGVYPRVSPGGWQVIGTTDATLWDLGRPQPALLTPGTRVRFIERGGCDHGR